MVSKKVTHRKKESKNNKYDPIRKILEEQRASLLKEVGALNSTLTPGIQTFSDLGDQASAESDRNFYIRLKEREQKLIKKIDLALEQIENGTFGICERCGKEIGLKRLKARPVATLCIDCKTEAEKEEKSRNL